MKTIAIVATGGTIAGKGEKGKTVAYHAGEVSINSILQSIPNISKIAQIKEYQLFNIDSNEINETYWLTLSNTINEIAQDNTIDGIVVTHGTDTLDETAYYLTLTIHTNKPVVITGAMRPATATSADGPYNLYQAISLACHKEAKNQGVMGLFSNTIYSGRDIQKINNYKIDAFDQKEFGSLGYMQDDKVYFFSKTFRKHTYQSIFAKHYDSLPKVAVTYFYAGASASILEFLAKENQGIVIIGSGNGNYSKEWMKTMTNLSKQGIRFVRTSRVSSGIVFNDHVFDPENCCIAGNTLSGQKARVLLMLALTKTNNIHEIRKIFQQY